MHDRIYLLGALAVACEDGEETSECRRSIAHLSDGPPEAIMAALPLKRDAQLIVGGRLPADATHRQAQLGGGRAAAHPQGVPGLRIALLPLQPPMIKFEESFRLHAHMAEFLRREIYAHDGINFHSRQRKSSASRGTSAA